MQCNKLHSEKCIRARDHYHITGKWRDSSHHICSATYILKRKIPVVFHNLRVYYNVNGLDKYMYFMWGKKYWQHAI